MHIFSGLDIQSYGSTAGMRLLHLLWKILYPDVTKCHFKMLVQILQRHKQMHWYKNTCIWPNNLWSPVGCISGRQMQAMWLVNSYFQLGNLLCWSITMSVCVKNQLNSLVQLWPLSLQSTRLKLGFQIIIPIYLFFTGVCEITAFLHTFLLLYFRCCLRVLRVHPFGKAEERAKERPGVWTSQT